MFALPRAVEPLVGPFAPAFTRPTFRRFVPLLVGAIVTTGRRTVTRILRTVGALAAGHPSSYHRFFSRARWGMWPLARALSAAVLALVPPDQAVTLAVDDTVAQHRGKHVYGKGCHRDAVRSAWGKLVHKWGHRWVVVAVVVRFPFAARPWALPVMCALYRPPKLDRAEHRRHKVHSDLARQLVSALMRQFPQRRFVLLGDGQFSGLGLADFARRRNRRYPRHRPRLTLIGRLRADAALYAKPPARRAKHRRGRRAIKGRKLRSPGAQVAHAKRRRLRVRWYGNSRRAVHVVSGAGIWYRCGLYCPIRWVYVRDTIGGRTDYFYTTDPRMSPRRIVESFAARWSIEVTFQEAREHLGWETTRQRCRASVLRSAPLLLGCFSVVSLTYARLLRDGSGRRRPRRLVRVKPTYRKDAATFADALGAVRRLLWSETILNHVFSPASVAKCPPRFKNFLLDQLSMAA